MRQCGDCQLCCKLVPVRALQKPAGQKCQFAKFNKGCTLHHTAKMPSDCQLWNCRWLVGEDTADLPRPDRAHCVIDEMPDIATAVDKETGARHEIQTIQIWVDPKYPDAFRAPAMRAYIERRAQEGFLTLIRYDNKRLISVIAPPFAKEWTEIKGEGQDGYGLYSE